MTNHAGGETPEGSPAKADEGDILKVLCAGMTIVILNALVMQGSETLLEAYLTISGGNPLMLGFILIISMVMVAIGGITIVGWTLGRIADLLNAMITRMEGSKRG